MEQGSDDKANDELGGVWSRPRMEEWLSYFLFGLGFTLSVALIANAWGLGEKDGGAALTVRSKACLRWSLFWIVLHGSTAAIDAGLGKPMHSFPFVLGCSIAASLGAITGVIGLIISKQR